MKKVNYSGQWSVVSGQWSDNRGQEFIPHPSSLILRRLLLSLAAVLCLTAGPAHALDISDYTAYPPFLPRVTSPNILFMLDYSESMVRPAYGNCKTIADVGAEGISDSDSSDINISNCRYRFSDVNYDYSSSTTYSGYFDASAKYNCSGGSSCSKNSGGVWTGNFLNWLTMTQFDIVKKVVVGGDVDSAPEMGNPTKLWSKLKQANNESDADYRKFRKTVNLPSSGNSTSCSSTDLPSGLCTKWPSVTYSWVGTPATGVTTVFGTEDKDNSISSAQTLPFPFTFYGNTYTRLFIDTNGTIRFNKEIFRDGAESGMGSWTATGLWKRQGSGDSCTNAATGSAGWYYGAWNNRDAWCNFETPITTTTSTAAATSGTLMSGSISLPAGSVYLGFASFYETESTSTSYDRRYVDISTNDGASWISLPPSPLSGDTMNTWLQKQIDISAYAGQNVKIRFRFESGDGVYNAFRGWYVDDIVIYTPPTTSYSSNDDIPDNDAPNNMIAPFWDDLLVCDDNNTGADEACGTYTPTAANATSVKTFTTGTAPNRIFVTTFYKMIHKDDTGKANPLTFQVLLYEGSNHIVFNYETVAYATSAQSFREGRTATIGVEDSGGTGGKKYSRDGSTLLTDGSAIFASPHISFAMTPSSSQETKFQPEAPLAVSSGGPRNDYGVYISINNIGAGPNCSSGSYLNKYRNQCYDHETEGLLQDFRDGELGGTLGFRLAIMQLNDTDGGVVKKHFNEKDTTGWSSLMSNTRSKSPTANTPLAEALQTAEGYFKQDTSYKIPTTATDANSWTNNGTGSSCVSTGNNYDPYCFQSAAQRVSCCKSFVLIVSSGNYSDDNRVNIYGNGVYPNEYANYNGSAMDANGQLVAGSWRAAPGETFGAEGTGPKAGWLDNVAYKAHTTDWRSELGSAGEVPGQNLTIYAINTFGAGSGTGTYVLKKAAKYGGFEDMNSDNNYNFSDANSNGKCDTGETWEDDKNCNGVPDTYFAASGGSDLKSTIIDAVMEIMKSSASGTSVSVLSTSAGGEGAIYQAYFYPAKLEGTTDERTWPGFMKSFFLDKKQNLRDDSSGGTYTCSGDSCTNDASPDSALVATEDKIAQMCLNTTTNEVKVKLYADAGGDYVQDTANDGSCPAVTSSGDPKVVGMDDVVSIWEAGKKLALRDKSTRKIYTWLNTGGTTLSTSTDGFSSIGGTALDFTTVAANVAALKPYLRAADPDISLTTDSGTLTPADQPRTADGEAKNIISFVRGNRVDTSAGTLTATIGGVSTVLDYRYKYRNRCVSIVSSTSSDESDCEDSNPDNQRVWALGDIINSTPTLVSGPGEQYDLLYSDSDYKKFRAKYQNRRRMVYVGANDGMLHAFNAGIFNESTTSFDANPSDDGWGAPALGAELWAFVPYDNLPHLQWLACNGTDSDPSQCGSSEYTHVYYVDSRPKVTDVRIFNDLETSVSGLIDGQSGASHPGGWGTIMIMSMRFGGGAIDVTIGTNREFRSAYYAFDVTDPEKPPKLLWRFYDPTLGFTTSYPAIVRICSAGDNPCTGTVKWYMVVGSGPNNKIGTQASGIRDYGGNSTDMAGKVFVIDLEDGSPDKTFTLESSNAYMGDPLVVDKDFDFTSDVIYIGSSINTGSTPVAGKVYRINTNGTFPSTTGTNWTSSTLFNATKPVLTAPSVAVDAERKLWVFFGTGRLRNSGDPSDLTNSEQQAFYGIKDACWENTLTPTSTPTPGKCDTTDSTNYAYITADLLDASGIKITVATGGTQVEEGTIAALCAVGSSCNYSELVNYVKNKKGWFVNLNDPTTASERVLSRAAVLGGVVLFTTYTPAASICSIFGDSRLYALNFQTGTAYSKAIVGSSSTGVGATASTTGTYVSKAIELGKGMPTAVGIAVGEKVTGFVQKSTGEIIRIEAESGTSVKSGAASWKEKSGGGGTSEIETIYKHIVK